DRMMGPSIVRGMSVLMLTAGIAGCGGGGHSAPQVIIPDVPAGAFEAGCQQLCTLGPNETVCTAKHAEYCLASCRARTRDPPLACSMASSSDCRAACRTAIGAQPRICAQCLIDLTGTGEICLNSDCDCANNFTTATLTCDTLCDTMPPM